MGSYTTNYNLYKPSLNDAPPDITIMNGNYDTIDATLKSLSDKSLGSGINLKLPVSTESSYARYVYLDPNGNDSNSGETLESPMKTIKGALNKYAGLQFVRLYLASGTYTESSQIVVNGFTNLFIKGAGKALTTINGAFSFNGGSVVMTDLTINASATDTSVTDAVLLAGTELNINNVNVVGKSDNSKNGIKAAYTSNVYISDTNLTNCNYAIVSFSGSNVCANAISGSNNTFGYSIAASLLVVNNSTMSATTPIYKNISGVAFVNGNLYGSTANTFVTASV